MLPSPSPPSPSRPKKVVTQRQYREKEGQHFDTLRDVIKELTREELPTRQQILKKAIDLLSVTSDTRMQIDAQVVPSASHSVLPVNSPATFTLDHAGHFAQWPGEACDCPQNWHPKDSYPGVARLYGQLDYSNADSRSLDNGSYQGHDKDSSPWSYHSQM